MDKTHFWRICLLLIGAMVLGCNGGISHELAGVWIGRPESAQARNARESEEYAKRLGIAKPAEQDQDDPADLKEVVDSQSADSTDWEQYDVAVRLEFRGRAAIELSLGEGSQPVSGTWRVVESTPAMVLIEFVTPSERGGDEPGGSEQVRRRFELQPDRRDGKLHGFTLSEVGADPMLGWLYFTRPGGE